MKRIISSTLLIALLLSFASVLLTSCGREKQIPIYRGMSLRNSYPSQSSGAINDFESEAILLSDNAVSNDDDANLFGQYRGDYVDRDAAIDAENPFPDSNASQKLEDALLNDFSSSPPGVYFPPASDDDESVFRVTDLAIHIENPDNFKIVSFIINDKQYTSDMFVEGSTGQIIYITPPYEIFKLERWTIASFSTSLTISNIKFLDGEEIKDVIIGGDTTVERKRANKPFTANVHDVNVGSNSLSFIADTDTSLQIKQDVNGVNGTLLQDRDLKAVLYDGERIVASQVLPFKGESTVRFDGLKANTLYQCLIVGYYKDFDEDEKSFHILYNSAFYTEAPVLFDGIEIGEDSISFGYLWNEDYENKEITALKLYMGEDYIKDIDASATSVDTLLAGTTYKLIAEYLDGDNTKSIYLEFTTLANSPL